MPLVVFLVSVVFSSLLLLTSARIVSDAAEEQWSVHSSSAVVAATSEQEQAWARMRFEDSTSLLQGLSYEQQVEEDGDLEMNQGIGLSAVLQTFDPSAVSQLARWRQSGAEMLLYDLSADQAVEVVGMDYCLGKKSACPDLVIEWMRFERGFQFQELADLADLRSNGVVSDVCVDWSEYGVQRCVWKLGMEVPAELDFTPFLDVDFRYSFRLQTHFPTYRYLVRVRSLDREPFDFQLFGIRGGEKVALPQSVLELDQVSRGQQSLRRIRDQKRLSAGLQDGLEFVHFADEVGGK